MTIGIRDAKFNLKEVRYQVQRDDAGSVLLVKANGEVYTVGRGGSCDCPDNNFRSRPSNCKHALAARQAGFFSDQNQGEQWEPSTKTPTLTR